MDKSSLEHYSESIYSHPISDDEIEIRLKTKKDDDIKRVELIYNNKYSFHECVKFKDITTKISDEVHTYYIIRVKLIDKRFAYIFKIHLYSGESYFFSESGVTSHYDITKGFYDFFQVPYINDSDLIKKHDVFQNRCVYQIFVDRFYKDENNKNERINIFWGEEVSSKSLAGGTIKGITEKLDYLSDLGIDALYLTPIFEAKSNHKYDTIDYFKIAKDFGSEVDLKELINESHKRGIIVVLDGVFNHVSSEHPFFIDVIKNGINSRYFNYFFINGDTVNIEKPNYETFADCQTLPRLNVNNLEVQEYILSIARHYIYNYHIDGFRLDVSDEIPHSFWVRFRKTVTDINPSFIVLGENWHNAQSFLNSGLEFHSIMNYSVTKNLLNYIAWGTYNSEQFKNRIISDLMKYKTNVNYNLMNLLSSHDVLRFLTECNGNVDKLLLAYAFIYVHIGVPCLYYGDEIGLTGGYDPKSRACFIWDETKWDVKIRETIKSLIHLHKDKKINERDYSIEVKNDLVIVSRRNENSLLCLIMNATKKDLVVELNGQILLSNNQHDNILKNNGFILLEVK